MAVGVVDPSSSSPNVMYEHVHEEINKVTRSSCKIQRYFINAILILSSLDFRLSYNDYSEHNSHVCPICEI